MRVFGCTWKINFPEIIFSWLGVLKALTRKLFEVKIFTSNHFRTLAQRERERESPDHSLDRAPIWRPKELQSDDHKPVSSHHATLAPIHTSTNQAKINSNAARSCLYRAIWWIFFLGFVSLVFLYDRIWWIFFWVLFLLYFCIEEWYYIFVWQLRKCIQ